MKLSEFEEKCLPNDMSKSTKILICGAIEQMLINAYFEAKMLSLDKESGKVTPKYPTWQSYKDSEL